MIYSGIRRRVCLYLIERVEISFPEDWEPDLTIKDVFKLWLLAEGDRR